MKIKSKFKDYYDSGMGYGYDDIQYIREVKPLSTRWVHRVYHGRLGGYGSYAGDEGTDLSVINICFCGYNYTCIRTGNSKWGKSFDIGEYSHPIGYEYYYTIEEVDKVVDKLAKRYKDQYYKKHGYGRARREYLEAVLSNNGKRHESYDRIQAVGIPIYVGADIRDDVIEYNAFTNVPLKNYEFFRVKDAFTCYQEINMFLSNVAHPNKPIPHVSDKDMIVAKGFDLRTSFRKEKKKEK